MKYCYFFFLSFLWSCLYTCNNTVFFKVSDHVVQQLECCYQKGCCHSILVTGAVINLTKVYVSYKRIIIIPFRLRNGIKLCKVMHLPEVSLISNILTWEYLEPELRLLLGVINLLKGVLLINCNGRAGFSRPFFNH